MNDLEMQKKILREVRDEVLDKYKEFKKEVNKYSQVRENIGRNIDYDDIVQMLFTYDCEEETMELERLITSLEYFEKPTNKETVKKIKEDMRFQKKKKRY